jgi:hypothetical protein
MLVDGSALFTDGARRRLGNIVTLISVSDLGPQKGLYTKNDWLADSVNVTARTNNRLSANPASTNAQRVMA